MAAEPAWPFDDFTAVLGAPDARMRAAMTRLRETLRPIEMRLSTGPAVTPAGLGAVTSAFRALARRLEASTVAEGARLVRRVDESESVIIARLGEVESSLRDEAVRHGRGTVREPRFIKILLFVSVASAAISVVGLAGWVVGRAGGVEAVAADPLAALPELPFLGPTAGEGAASRLTSAAARAVGPAAEIADYDSVVAAVRRGDPQGLTQIAALASSGNVKAQLFLASLYEQGRGAPRDLMAARAWTQKAAEAGDPVAMHNLGLYLMQGEGGPMDAASAAQWFRRAAELGVVDSQYNLGLLYEAGRGVERDLSEAHRWFAAAAKAGDAASKARASALEAAAGAKEPTLAAANADLIIPPAKTLAETQELLAGKGYYLGPTDGVASPALKAAVAAYRGKPPPMTP